MTLVFVILMCLQEIKAQVDKVASNGEDLKPKKDDTQIENTTYVRSDWKKIEIDFLNSYYSQDGNNAAVTGGIGTEQLTDFTQKIAINVPLNPGLAISADASYDYYSSASTDNIDNIRSSDSSSDVRTQFGVGIQITNNEQFQYGARVGASTEYDYNSIQGGFNFSIISKNQNRKLDVFGQAFVDKWSTYYPSELRGEVSVPTKQRQSYNLAVNYSQVVSKRSQFSFLSEVTYMNGLLSTPFHRVYFQNNDVTIENLPSTRYKVPLGLRWNYHLSEKLILRSYYRYYWDNWGMQGHTASIEIPIKINRFFAIYPHYRYHTQTAVDHFKGYKEHSSDTNYYTSDYDLSALISHSYGVGILYSRPNGIASVNLPLVGKKLSLEAIDLKASMYDRSTGLNAFIVSFGIKISL